jgi:hypothetical protein
MQNKQGRKFLFGFVPLLFVLSSGFWCLMDIWTLAILCLVAATLLLAIGIFSGDTKLLG